MSGDLIFGDLAAKMRRGTEVQDLAGRVAVCADRVARVIAGFREIQLLEWQSPAGRAYRDSVALQEVQLGRARVVIEDAVAAVGRYAQEVASAPAAEAAPAGHFRWPR
jgi:ABC-type amino acid transport substrate-binding protein